MNSKAMKWIEQHIEKIIVGLAGAFLIALLYLYIFQSPNKVDYNGKQVAAGELNQSVYAAAQELDQRVRTATPGPSTAEQYSTRLRQEQERGIFASKSPSLRPALTQATAFGGKIEVPGLDDAQDTSGNITPVTPLAPTQPVVSSGRSLVIPKQISLSADSAAAPAAGESEAAVEQAWVTVAAYFDKRGQQNEMNRAKYAPYRSKVYVAGVDVQRQEQLATGQWSDWQDVKAGKAMPALELKDPVIDDVTGSLHNKDEIDSAFALVKGAQNTLMEPPFLAVKGGSDWKTPPLPGHDDSESDDVAIKVAPPKKATPAPSPRAQAPSPPLGRGGGSDTVGGSGGLGPRGGGGGGGLGGGGLGGPSAAAQAAKQKEENRKRAQETLKEARKAMGDKKYSEALTLAQQVAGNQDANANDKKVAEDIVQAAQKKLASSAQTSGVASEGAPMMRGFSGRGFSMQSGGGASAQTVSLVTNPDGGAPAVWFHDDTVQSGKTYRYRMRVKLWNRYVGQMRALKNPEDARKVVIPGEWSIPSQPVTVTPSTYFFVKGGRPDTQRASVDVWKWREGKWIKQSFEVGVGDIIGGLKQIKLDDIDPKATRTQVDFSTGALVLDLRMSEPIKQRIPGKQGVFKLQDQTSVVLVYLDPADGQVKERIQAYDKNDPFRKVLEQESGLSWAVPR